MRFQNMAIGEALILAEFLKLTTGNEVVALLSSKYLEHLLRIAVKVKLIQLPILEGQDLLQESLLCELLGLLVWKGHYFNTVGNQVGFHILVQL